jgi:multiple sugar transport system permease protein
MKRETAFAYLFVLPALALFIVFRLVPLVFGSLSSFTDWNGIADPRWIGLGNYAELLTDPVFQATMLNTLKVLITLPIWVGLPLILAIFIYLEVPAARLYRGVYFFPIVLSSIITGTMFSIILRFDGTLNQFVGLAHIPAVDWLGDSRFALLAVILVAIWAHFGMSVMIFLSGLTTIPPETIEAARVDGATLMQIIWRIIIPMVRPTIELVVVMTTITILTSMFGLIYVMTGGGPGTATYMPEFVIWLMQGQFNRLGYASAMSVTLFVVVALVGIAQIRLMRSQWSQ